MVQVSATEAELKAAFDAQTEEVRQGASADGTWGTFDPSRMRARVRTRSNTCARPPPRDHPVTISMARAPPQFRMR